MVKAVGGYSTAYLVHVDVESGAVMTAAQRRRRAAQRLCAAQAAQVRSGAPVAQLPTGVEDGTRRVQLAWSAELEAQLRAVYRPQLWRAPRLAPVAYRAPRASGKASRELMSSYRHLLRLAVSCPREQDRELAAALARDVEAAVQVWTQQALPLQRAAA